jgi:hypothetical protein
MFATGRHWQPYPRLIPALQAVRSWLVRVCNDANGGFLTPRVQRFIVNMGPNR